jgi:hypothetical protein
MKLLALVAIAGVAWWLFRRAFPHDAFDQLPADPDVEYARWLAEFEEGW